MVSSQRSSDKLSQRSGKVVGLQHKFDTNNVPNYLDINDKVYFNGTTVGDKTRAEEELERFKRMYGEGFIVKTTSYAVYGYNAKETADRKYLKSMLKSNNPKEAEMARSILKQNARDVKEL